MRQIIFSIATVSDIETIHQLVESVYRGENSRKGWTTEADWLDGQRTDPDTLKEMMSASNGLFLLAHHEGQLVGSVFLEKKTDHAYLGMLSVDVNKQNLRIGRALLENSEELVKGEWQLSEIRIQVLTCRQELINWYRRRGFLLTEERTDFPNDTRFGIVKVSGLQFVKMIKILQ